MITNLEREMQELQENIADMMNLVYNQLEKSEECFSNQDIALAKEIHQIESRVNAADLSIDKDIENIIALYNPVASDLRFVLASHKIVAHLERIGDHADKIARYVRKKQIKSAYDAAFLNEIRIEEMFDNALEMVRVATQSFVEEDSKQARLVFSQDITLNEIYNEASQKINDFSKKENIKVEKLLYIFSIINKLERVGDLAKNIAEETIFYIEAKVLRHKKLKKKSKTSNDKESTQ